MSRLLSHSRSKTFQYSLLAFVAIAVSFAVYAHAATPNPPAVPADLKAIVAQAQAAGIRAGGIRAAEGSEAPTVGWVGYTKCTAVQSWPDYTMAYLSDGSSVWTSYVNHANTLATACASDQYLFIYWTGSTTWSDVYFNN